MVLSIGCFKLFPGRRHARCVDPLSGSHSGRQGALHVASGVEVCCMKVSIGRAAHAQDFPCPFQRLFQALLGRCCMRRCLTPKIGRRVVPHGRVESSVISLWVDKPRRKPKLQPLWLGRETGALVNFTWMVWTKGVYFWVKVIVKFCTVSFPV